jgi:hypothetical protein
MTFFSAFGLWWALAPRSVVAFYRWFHRKRLQDLRMPSDGVIRLMGLAWVALVVAVCLTAGSR